MSRKFFVKDTDYATEDTAGVVKLGSGLSIDNNGKLNVTGGTPYIYMDYDDYSLLTSVEADKLYWLTDSRGKHAVYMNGAQVEGEDIKHSYTWSQIQSYVRNGIIQNIYSVGDQLSVNYNGSAVMFDIVAFDVVTPADSNYTHSMTLIPHDCLENLMFDNKEPNNSNSDRKNYGNNRYLYSNIRKWLNSNGEAGNWWTAQHSADAAPDYATTKAGFMNYFDSAFLYVIGKTKIRTAKDSADGGGYEDLSDDYFYLPSRTEVGLPNENGIAEGTLFPYFSSSSKRMKLRNGSKVFWWLRTPRSDTAINIRGVHTTGDLADYNAYTNHCIAPACNII